MLAFRNKKVLKQNSSETKRRALFRDNLRVHGTTVCFIPQLWNLSRVPHLASVLSAEQCEFPDYACQRATPATQWLLWKSAEEAAGSASLLPALYTGRPLSIAKSSDYLESIFKERGRGSLVIRASNITSNDFRPGVMLELDGAPWKVVEFLHVKPGKGAAFVRTKLKNYITGNVVDKTFRAGESATQAVLEKRDCQYTYSDGDEFVFMDNENYEETRLKRDDAWAKYMKEGTEASLLFWNGKVISVDPPTNMELEVTDTDPGVKGNTVSGGSKPATLETGAVIQVPLFVSIGEKISVDTRTDTYLGRGKKSF